MKYVYLFFLSILVVSCSSKGFKEETIRKRLSAKHIQISDQEIKSARTTESKVSFPIKLAIYLDFSAEDSRWRSYWDWFSEDERIFLELEKELKTLGVVSKIVVIPNAAVHGWNFGALRKAAARYKADSILLVNGIPFVDTYANGWSAAYLTLAGLWLAPGTNKDALFALEGSIWDVNNQYLHTTFQERGFYKLAKPWIYIRDTEVIQKAKEKGLKAFVRRFSREIRKLAGYTDQQIDEQEREKTRKKQEKSEKKLKEKKEAERKLKEKKEAERNLPAI